MAKAGQGRFLLALLLFLGLTVLGSSAAESFPIKAIKRFSLFQHPEYFMMVRGGQPFWVGSGSGSEETKRAALSPEGPPGRVDLDDDDDDERQNAIEYLRKSLALSRLVKKSGQEAKRSPEVYVPELFPRDLAVGGPAEAVLEEVWPRYRKNSDLNNVHLNTLWKTRVG